MRAPPEPPFRRVPRPGCEWITETVTAPKRRAGSRRLFAAPSSRLDPSAHLELTRLILVRALAQPEGPDAPSLSRAAAHAAAAAHGERRLEATRLGATVTLLAGEMQEGLRAVERVGELAPGLRTRVRIDAARLLLEAGEIEPAGPLLELVPEALEEQDWLALGRAMLDRQRGMPRAAHRRLVPLRRRRGGWRALEEELARCAWEEGDIEAAVARFSEIRRGAPDSAAAQVNLVLALFAAGRGAEGEAALRSARPSVRADPTLRAWIRSTSQARPLRPESETESALVGRLGAISLTDLISLLGHSRSTGALVIESDEGTSEVWLREGKLVGARAPRAPRAAREPEEHILAALEAVLECAQGSFRFEAGRGLEPTAVSSTIAIETPVALLQACASLDERRRARAR